MEDVLGLKRPVCLLKKDSPVGWISPATAVVAPSSLRAEDQIHEFGEEGNMLRFDAVVQFMAKICAASVSMGEEGYCYIGLVKCSPVLRFWG